MVVDDDRVAKRVVEFKYTFIWMGKEGQLYYRRNINKMFITA